MATSTVSPEPHPSSRYVVPKSSAVRTTPSGPSVSNSPSVALASTSGDALLEPVPEPATQPADGIGIGARADEDVVSRDLHVEAGGVVGPRVERASAGQVEAGVVPVAGHEPRLDRALVEGEAEVRAAVLDAVGHPVVPYDQHGK